jgi:hypothetical protein
MTPDSPPDEVIFIEEQVGQLDAESPERSLEQQGQSRGRTVAMAVGGLALGLAATTVAARIVRGRTRTGGRRRGSLLNLQTRFQPRAAVFAPNLAVSLPFSRIDGRRQGRRGRNSARRGGPFARQHRTARRGRMQTMTSRLPWMRR